MRGNAKDPFIPPNGHTLVYLAVSDFIHKKAFFWRVPGLRGKPSRGTQVLAGIKTVLLAERWGVEDTALRPQSIQTAIQGEGITFWTHVAVVHLAIVANCLDHLHHDIVR